MNPETFLRPGHPTTGDGTGRRRALQRLATLAAGAAGLAFGPAAAQPAPAASGAGHGAHGGHGAAAGGRRARPQLASGVAIAPDGRLWIARLDGPRRLVVQSSDDLGGRWSDPVVVPTGGEPVAADGESHPKIAFGPGGVVVVAYTRPGERPFTGDIRLARSTDGGVRFDAPATVHQDRQPITHRFESVLFDAGGRLHVAWIDKRDQEAARAAGRRYDGAAVYRAVSDDGGATFRGDVKVADASCECCRIALAPTPDGGVAAMWRHVFPGQVRDHAFARWHADDRARAPDVVRASVDGWVVAGCPHHGPGLAPAAGGGWHAVWFGERAGVGAVRLGRLAPEGRPVGPVRQLPDATAEHAVVGAAGRHVVVAWRAFDAGATHWRAWVSDDDGATFARRDLGRTAGESDQPRLAVSGSRIVGVWRTADDGIRVADLSAGRT